MIGTFSVFALLINIAVGLAVAGLAIVTVLALRPRRPRYYIGRRTEGKRGRFWVGIQDEGGTRKFQTAPPGFANEDEANQAAEDLVNHGVGWRD